MTLEALAKITKSSGGLIRQKCACRILFDLQNSAARFRPIWALFLRKLSNIASSSLIAKIAFGVFIGAVAAWLAVAWMQQSWQEHMWRRADGIMAALTPEALIERCGEPFRDVLDGRLRYLYYRDPSVSIVFALAGNSWAGAAMHEGGIATLDIGDGRTIASVDGREVRGTRGDKRDWAFAQIALMPCLEGK